MKKVWIGCGIVLVVGFLCLVAGVGGLAVIGWLSEAGGESGLSTPAAVIPTLTPGAGVASPVPTLSQATATPFVATPAQPVAAFTPAITPLADKVPYRAVVQIVAETETEGGNLRPVWSGSGTIVDPRGFILTNAHVALPEPGSGEQVDALEILVTEAEDQPPVPKYFAEVVQADPQLDLAVLRITTDLDGNPVDALHLNLPYARLGDSSKLHLGEPIVILGYPGIGGNTITLTSGEVSGFTAEKPYGRRAFIKTSAAIAGGNSGGMAVNAAGELVAIPTQLGSGSDNSEVVDCRYLADTNGDGVIDEDDDCVPTGGFINALRPINLAKPLIAAALRGEVAIGSTETPTPAPLPVAVTPWPTGRVLLQDDFSDPDSGWPTSSSEDSEVGYRNGQYRIDVKSANWETWAYAGEDFDDVIVEVDITKVSGDNTSDFGVLCRYQDKDHAYQFAIGADGYYQIFRWEPDDEKMLLGDGEWLSSDAIREGNATNHLRAECVGDTLALYVNGTLIGAVRDTAYTHGDIALAVGTYDHGGTDVRFDNLVVYAPAH